MAAMKQRTSSGAKTTVSVVISEEFYRELKMKAALEERSLSSLLEQLLHLGLQEYEKRSLKGIPAGALSKLIGTVNYQGDALKDSEEIYD